MHARTHREHTRTRACTCSATHACAQGDPSRMQDVRAHTGVRESPLPKLLLLLPRFAVARPTHPCAHAGTRARVQPTHARAQPAPRACGAPRGALRGRVGRGSEECAHRYAYEHPQPNPPTHNHSPVPPSPTRTSLKAGTPAGVVWPGSAIVHGTACGPRSKRGLLPTYGRAGSCVCLECAGLSLARAFPV